MANAFDGIYFEIVETDIEEEITFLTNSHAEEETNPADDAGFLYKLAAKCYKKIKPSKKPKRNLYGDY